MIELRNINKNYGERAIFTNFNLTIDNNKMTAISGKSGVGKSTLLQMIGMLEKQDSGDIFFDSMQIGRNRKRLYRYELGYLFQNYALIDNETVKQNLQISTRFLKIPKQQKEQLMLDVLKKVGMEHALNAKVYTLSGGEQQRVAIARAFLKPSKVILADEPTGSLDPENRDIILHYFKELKEMGKTIVIVTHDPEVIKYCDVEINLDVMK